MPNCPPMRDWLRRTTNALLNARRGPRGPMDSLRRAHAHWH